MPNNDILSPETFATIHQAYQATNFDGPDYANKFGKVADAKAEVSLDMTSPGQQV